MVRSGAVSSGCGVTSPWTFDSDNRSNQTIGEKNFIVHIAAPGQVGLGHVMLFFFNGNGNDTQQPSISGFSENNALINGKSIVTVYPTSTVVTGSDAAPGPEAGLNTIDFTNSIIDQVQANLCVDTDRIYAVGEGTGSSLVNLLACNSSTASRIAAFAPMSAALHAGTDLSNGCEPGRPIPIFDYHGTADNMVSVSGASPDSDRDATPTITQYREAWALRNGCASTIPTFITQPHTNTTLTEWNCSSTDPDAVIKGYTVAGGLTGGIIDYNATTADLLSFFEAHHLR